MRMAWAMHLDSLFFGSTSSNAMRLSSMKPFQPVFLTSPCIFLLSIDGPNDMTP